MAIQIMPSTTSSLLPALLAFAAVLAMIPMALAAYKKWRSVPPGNGPTLRLVASLSLGSRERVCIVQVGSQHLALGVTAQAISALGEVTVDSTAVTPTANKAAANGTAANEPATNDLADRPARLSPSHGSFARVLSKVTGRMSARLFAAAMLVALALPQATDSYAQTPAPTGAQPSSRGATAPANAGKAGALPLPANTSNLGNGSLSINSAPLPGGGASYSVPIQTLLVFTALSFLPAILLLMTSFTRIIIVLSLLRQALGLQTTPPNQVLVGMALFLTLFVMGPTLDRVHAQAYKPYAEQKISLDQALESGAEPLRAFMLKQTRAADLTLFANIAKLEGELSPTTIPMRILIPAFVTSELKTAFQIGFLVFVPFLIIDLIVASVLMSMGMMMLSPVLVALPFKLMLFVLADGWSLLMSSLVASFGGA